MTPVDKIEAVSGNPPTEPTPLSSPRVHPIVELGFRVRVPAHLCTLLMLASSFFSTGAPTWVWVMGILYGVVWPHLARFIGMRSRDSRAAELRNLLTDSAMAGAFAALCGFSLWPSVVLATGANSACLSVGGPRFALRAFALCLLSAAVFSAINGYGFTPESSLVTSIISAVSLLGYTAIFSLRTHVEAKRIIRVQRDLHATNRQMEEQRLVLKHALELAETANRAKSAFLANMSHELRTPLNAIIGYAELLEEDAADAHQRADLQKIHTSGKHLLGLINDVLDLSKIEAGKVELQIERFDVGQFLDQVISTMQPLLVKNANRLELHAQASLGSMTGDANRLRQVLLNMLSNAAKFTHNGVVRLNVSRHGSLAAGSLNVESLVFEISDTGIGMSAEQLDKLFNPFVQADAATTRKYGGTGLGLSISRRLCEMMGGEIAVRSELGRGSCFTVTVPAEPESQSAQIAQTAQDVSAGVPRNEPAL